TSRNKSRMSKRKSSSSQNNRAKWPHGHLARLLCRFCIERSIALGTLARCARGQCGGMRLPSFGVVSACFSISENPHECFSSVSRAHGAPHGAQRQHAKRGL